MKQFIIDELRPAEYEKLKKFLDNKYDVSALEGIYWLPIAPEVLSGIKAKHKDCQPFYFAFDLEHDRIIFELLVRTKTRVKCACIGYATESQCTWLIRQMDEVFAQLEIKF